MRTEEKRTESGGDSLPPDADGGSGSGRERRLFMAGRVEGRVQQVRFAPSVRAPIRGPWSLALVVRPG